MRDLEDILGDLAVKWKDLDDIQKSNIAYLAAGIRQKNIFLSLMENYTRAEELYGEAVHGTGATMKSNEVYLDSYRGKLNTLKGVWQGFASELADSSGVKALLDTFTTLLQVISPIAPVLGMIATVAVPLIIGGFVNTALSSINLQVSLQDLLLKLTGFNIKAKETVATNTSLSASFASTARSATTAGKMVNISTTNFKLHSGVVKASTAASAGATLATTKFASAIGVLKVAVSTLSIALAAVTFALPLIKKLVSAINPSFQELSEKMGETTNKLKALNDEIQGLQTVEGAIKSIGDAFDKYGDDPFPKMPTEEAEKYREQVDLLKQTFPSLQEKWTDYASVNKEDLNELINQNKILLDLKLNQAATDLADGKKSVIKADKKLDKEVEKLNEYGEQVKFLSEIIDKAKEEGSPFAQIGAVQMPIESAEMHLQSWIDKLNESKAKIAENGEAVDAFLVEANRLNQAYKQATGDETAVLIDTSQLEYTIDRMKEVDEYKEKLSEEVSIDVKFEQGIDNYISGGLESNFYKEIQQGIDEYGNLEEAMWKSYDVVQKIVNAQQELTENGAISTSTLRDLAETYGDIYTVENDRANMGLYLNSIKDEEWNKTNDLQTQMEDHYQYLLLMDEEYYKTKMMNSDLVTGFIAQANAFILENGGNTTIADAQTFQNGADFKANALATLMQFIQDVNIEERGLIQQTADLIRMLGGATDGIMPKRISMPTFKRPSMPKPTSRPSSGRKPSKKPKKEKEVEDLKLKINLFYKWEKAIQDVEHQLNKLDKVLETATGKKKVDALKKQIELYEKLAKEQKGLLEAQKKEASNLQKQISNHGFTVKDDGTITNYTKRLQDLQKWANSASGEEKEARKKKVQEIKELVDEYVAMIEKINDTELEVDSLAGNIKDVKDELEDYYNELLDTVSDVESEITSMIEKELEKRKKAMVDAYNKQIELLNKAKEAYTKQNEEEDWQKEYDKEKTKLMELQNAINLAMRDTSLAGQKQLADLQKEYEEQKNKLEQMQTDKDRQDQEDWYDDQIKDLEEERDKAEEEWDKKYDEKYIASLVKELIGNGFTTIEGDIINIADLMKDNFEGAFGLLGDKLQSEFLDKLEEAQKIAANINNIFKELDVNLNPRNGFSNGGTSISSASKQAMQMTASLSSYLRNGIQATQQGSSSSMSIGSLLSVNGNIDRTVMPNLESIVDKAVEKLEKTMKTQIRLGTGII